MISKFWKTLTSFCIKYKQNIKNIVTLASQIELLYCLTLSFTKYYRLSILEEAETKSD